MTETPVFAAKLLPRREQPDLQEIRTASHHAALVERHGPGRGSLTGEGLRYGVLDYDACAQHAPGLTWWAYEKLPSIASALTGVPLVLLRDMKAAVNINVLEGVGEKYELHVDSVPYTAILFASGPHDGGWLMADVPGMGRQHVKPEPGLLLVLEGDKIPHAVSPLNRNERRVSVPISLTEVGASYERPAGVDQHLYG